MKRKFLCLLLALTMVLGLAATVSADENRITSGDWVYRISEGKAVILDYNGTDAHVVVPAELDGYAVSEIGDAFLVFSDAAETMTSVTVSEGIEIINSRSFMNCTALQKVVLPGTVRYIGSSAFEGCTSLSDVTLSEGLKTIHRYAFLNTALTSIFIPASVTELDEDSVGYTGEWGDTDQVEGFTIYGYTGTSAEWYAEYWRFNFVDMGANYDNSGRCGDGSAFWEYTAATRTLHIFGHDGRGGYMYDYDEVEEIPWFVHMPLITNVVVEDVLDICDYAFQDCSELTTVTMSDTVKTIGACAFKNTPKLTDVTLSANLDFIRGEAFSHSGLTAIELPESLTGIGTHAFEFTPLTSIEIPDTVELSQGAFYHCTELASVKLPAELNGIIPLLFQGCTSLKSIDLPETITSIGRQAFSRSGLTSIEIPDSVVLIDENAFYECLSLEYVKLPASLEEAGWRCFQDCDKLSTIVMPEGINTNFGQWFFLSCDSLTNLDFHTAPIIGMAMYGNCNGLTNLNIPDCVTTISGFAFDYCENLSYVTIPAGVTEFGAKPFHDCPKLGAIAFRGDAPAFHEFAFEDTTVTCYYPADNATWTEEVRQSYNGEVTWIPYEVLPFTDVPAGSFYYDPVAWAVENGVTTGATATTFNPNGQCLRAQVVTFLWRAEGCPEPETAVNPFVDVKESDFYYKAVLWAVENGITNGADATHFNPMGVCNRAQVVTFLHRAKNAPAPESMELPFTDVPAESWYTAPVAWAVENGVTNGMSATEFAPDAPCNRAQVVTFLYRAKDIPKADPIVNYTFELRSNDPTEETGFVLCEGTEFAAGESVIFYAEPWYGYLVEFTAEPDVELELYYLGACTYELVMPAHDVVLTANFVPAPGEHHFINTTCENGEFFALCDFDEDLRDFAKAGEFVQFYVMPDEGFTLTPENITLTVGGEPWEDWWFLGELVEEIPEEDLVIDGIFLFEAVMPEGDLEVSITCTPGTEAASAQVRVPVSLN